MSIHHAQVAEAPFAFFAVNAKYLEPFALTRRIIINPRIATVDENSVVYMKEACMSFPYRSGKHVLRYGRITVEYQIPIIGALEKLVEECTGSRRSCFNTRLITSRAKTCIFIGLTGECQVFRANLAIDSG